MKNDSGFPLEEQKPKPFEDLTFHDDFMFGIVMQDREICREALECMLRLQRPRPGKIRQGQFFSAKLSTPRLPAPCIRKTDVAGLGSPAGM